MPLVLVSSPKGGVGKTSLAANLAVALARQQRAVTAVDFDPQNGLRFHFGIDRRPEAGLGACLASGADLSGAVLETGLGVRLIPHGTSDLAQQLAAEQRVTTEDLRARFQQLAPGPRDIVIADTPPGESRFLSALQPLADIMLVVFLADAGSMALLPAYGGGLFLRPQRPGEARIFALLNQVDPRRRLSREISEFVRERLFDRFIGTVHYDEAMAEALANGTTLIAGSTVPAGAAQDMLAVADRISALLVER